MRVLLVADVAGLGAATVVADLVLWGGLLPAVARAAPGPASGAVIV